MDPSQTGPPVTVATCKELATVPVNATPFEFCRALGMDDRTWAALHTRGIVDPTLARGQPTVPRDKAIKEINRRTAELAAAAEHCGGTTDELVARLLQIKSFVGPMEIGGQVRVFVSEVNALP